MNRNKRIVSRDGVFNQRVKNTKSFWFPDLYHSLLKLSWLRFFLVVIFTYFSINIFFGFLYYLCGIQSFDGMPGEDSLNHFLNSFFFSVQVFSTIGFGKIMPTGLIPNIFVALEALCGLFIFALATGLLFARFSKPTARVVFSNYALIGMHDGERCLIFRMANERRNRIVDAHVDVILSVLKITAEGKKFRTFYTLKLKRERSPIFSLTWTVAHVVDEKSALYQQTFESLKKAHAEIVVSLTGIDDTFSQTIHCPFSYMPQDILWDRSFEDMITFSDEGTIIDMAKIHDVLPVHPKK